jgi:clan AA aspartic protease
VDRRDRERSIDAVIDTGFTGWLTLPPELIAELRLLWRGFGHGILADGSECFYDIYQVSVLWDGRVRRIRVSEADMKPLIGMALMKGYELNMQVRSRGKVTIKPL